MEVVIYEILIVVAILIGLAKLGQRLDPSRRRRK